MRQRTSDLFNNRAGDMERVRLERDRYRKALEEIVSEEAACGLNLRHGLRAVVQIAREALAPEGT